MSHLILKKVDGKYRFFNKEKDLFQGPAIADKEKAQDILKAVDRKEDKIKAK